MPFIAKSAKPAPADIALRNTAFQQSAVGGTTIFIVPPGCLSTDSLIAALNERGRSSLWLRLGPEDGDPGTFLVSLIGAAQRSCPGVGAITLAQMRRQPGPLFGWAPLFECLGQELSGAFPTPDAIVLEHVHYLDEVNPTLALLGTRLLPVLRADVACILTSPHRLPSPALPAPIAYHTASDLRLDVRQASDLFERAQADLSHACIKHMLSLTQGQAGVLAGLSLATTLLGSALISQAADHARDRGDLLARVARAWLSTASPDLLSALALAMRLEYSHPKLIQAALDRKMSLAGAWMQRLDDDWTRVRRAWHSPLRAALPALSSSGGDVLRRTAGYLEGEGAVEQAVSLYFDIGDMASAARAIAAAADAMIDLGQWETLENWIDRLPPSTLQGEPRLVYARGEIAAAHGRAENAQCDFATSAALFSARHNAHDACRSLLAESAVAASRGELMHAQARATAASAVADAAGLAGQRVWAEWQLGCLAAAAGELDEALACFNRAAMAITADADPRVTGLIGQAKELILCQYDLQRQRELHRQAYFASERAEREAADRLRLWLSAPFSCLGALLGTQGWSCTPMMLKLPSTEFPATLPDVSRRTNRWDALRRALGFRRRATASAATFAAVGSSRSLDVPSPMPVAQTPSRQMAQHSPDRIGPATDPSATSTQAPPALGEWRQERRLPALAIYCLGSFRVYQNDQLVKDWSSLKSQSILRYLAAHWGRRVAKDVLMDVFWPNADPEAARRNLHQAVYSLRQTLKHGQPDHPYVRFENDCYLLDPEMDIWLDFQEFDKRVQAGRRLEAAGKAAEAMIEYGIAEGLYQGDFLEEELYEDWPRSLRESIRATYLTIADRLSEHYLQLGEYAPAMLLCRKILALDRCSEETHRRLMQCYLAQGQRHLAVEQYQVCIEALQKDLSLTPSPETQALYRSILAAP